MRYSQTNKAQLSISELAVGTWGIGKERWGEVDDAQAKKAILTALDSGVNLIDTAPAYGAGTAETTLGKAIKGLDRSQLFISTKCGLTRDARGDQVKNTSSARILQEIDESLRRLQTDYIDIYFVHWPDAKTPIQETMEALVSMKKAGKIRCIGLSNFSIDQIKAAEEYAEVDAVQLPFSMVDTSAQKTLEWAAKAGKICLSYGSLGAGVLTGRYRSLPEFAKNDFRFTFYDYFREPKFSRIMELLKTLEEIASEHGAKTCAEVALNWVCQKSFVSSALVGFRTPEHALELTRSFDWKLSPEELQRIDDEIVRLKTGELSPVQKNSRPQD